MRLVKWILLILLAVVFITYVLGFLGFGNLGKEELIEASYIDIKGESLRVLEKGQGQDVLLIHGTPGSIEDMQPLLDSLAKDHHVVAYDRPGHGYSSANDIPGNLPHNTMMAEELISYYQMDSAIVIGHSYGGIIAMNMAVNRNENIEQYFVLGSPLFTFNCEPIFKLFKIPILRRCLSFLASGPYSSSKIKEDLPTRFATDSAIPTEEFVNFRKDLWAQPKVILSTSLETAQIEDDMVDIIPKYNTLQKDLTIILGEDDVPYYITDLKQHLPLPNVTAHFYPATGHFIQMESLNQLLADIRVE